jgi:hypothetical protein
VRAFFSRGQVVVCQLMQDYIALAWRWRRQIMQHGSPLREDDVGLLAHN